MVLAGPPSRPRVRRSTDRPLTGAVDDRQVLVVGGGIAGFAAAATLRRAGYDPVVLTDPDRMPPSAFATLHPLGRSLLCRLTPKVDDWADPGVVALAGTDTDGRGTDEQTCPVGTTTDAVRARLATGVPADARRTDALRHLERDGDALRARFASGVSEWFDLVVAADGPASAVRATRDESLDATDVAQAEARLPVARDVAAGRETWTDDAVVQALPHPAGGTLVRVTTDRIHGNESPEACLRRGLDALDGPDANEPTDVVARAVTQAEDGGDWSSGRVAYCGAAAFPQVPATGLRTTLALADAGVLADELLAGPTSVTGAVSAYGRRRRRHVELLRESFDGRADWSGPDPLGSVHRDRSVSVDGCGALADVGVL